MTERPNIESMLRPARVRLFYRLRHELESGEPRPDAENTEKALQAALIAYFERRKTTKLADQLYWADHAANFMFDVFHAMEAEMMDLRGKLAEHAATGEG